MVSDAELIRECRNGSIEAFEQVVGRYKQFAFKIAYGMLGNDRDAEDMVQEAFITVYRQIKGLRSENAFSSWLGKIVTNLCLRKLQKSIGSAAVSLEALEERQAPAVGGEDPFKAADLQHDVREALLKLPVDYRVVIVLRDLQGYPYNEIAEITGIPLGTVKSRLHQARTMLAELLEPAGGGRRQKDDMS